MGNRNKTKSDRQVENKGCFAVANGDEQNGEIFTDGYLSQLILDQTMEGIVVCDVQGRIMCASKAAHALCGSDPVSKVFEEVFPLQIKNGEKDYTDFCIKDVLDSKVVQCAEANLINASGILPGDMKVFNLIMNASPLRNSEKAVVGCLVILSDVTEQRRIKRRKGILYTITRVLAETATFKEAVPKILQAMCESLEWDVGVFWAVEGKTSTLHCSEIWHKPSVEIPEFEALTRQIDFSPHVGLPGSVYATKTPLWIANVVSDANFPRAVVAAKEKLHGAFGFPVITGKHILGVIEFFSHEIQPADDDLLTLMASIGDQIGQFVERKRSEEALIHRIDFEKTIASVSSRFVAFTDFNEAVFKSLADAGRLCEAGRAYLFQFRDNSTFMDNTNEWCAGGVAPEIQHLQNLPTAMFPWLMENLRAGNVIHVADVSQMPDEAAVEKREFEKRSIRAILILPVHAGRELAGFVGFDSVAALDPWHEEDIALLHIIAEIIGNAIARKHSEALVTYMAYYDTLTTLPNRNLFHDRLKVALAHAKRYKKMVAVMILDLDHFKAINDALGHHVGDLLLKGFAERLTQCVRKGDTVARTGGDEFTIILPDLVHALNTVIVASKISDALNQPFSLEGHEIHTTTSIGISLYPLDAESPEELIKKADIAMYLSKARGKNTYRFYKSDMNTRRTT